MLQSGFRPGHSTETAVLQVLSELLQAVDRGNFGTLVLLDLTAAFDTVDQDIRLQRLQQTFGIDGAAHRWLRSYLVGQTQYTYVAALSDRSSLVFFVACRRDPC